MDDLASLELLALTTQHLEVLAALYEDKGMPLPEIYKTFEEAVRGFPEAYENTDEVEPDN
ncbi:MULTISPECIES: hypothetical protein [unclassified Prochlorococcus]|uniref:hypothetical protein n=1 Tax=unclassified Prochlorococcus TaxID=2627481 RepID=UPI000533A68B|nr:MULTISPECIES: hypothetical protein [unclassified Prochlorococcus]KGG25561.1 hypothetical protein EV12_2134 [Prochlorococcus sp. MIT 0701]KGG30686.1 hypothetical protein EV13_0056 [Prochlorococcus sp. MIT 0702]KGG34870.1 hypothetical protein EV14_1067 [Prochlorococcus sp. MIT 0703]